MGSGTIYWRHHVTDCCSNTGVLRGRGVSSALCTLQHILRDNSESKSILEARFGPLQEKDFRAADALAVTRGMAKPVLLIHGTGDETAPVAHGMRLAESIGDVVRFVPIEGGNHHLRNVDPNAVIKEITDWLMSH